MLRGFPKSFIILFFLYINLFYTNFQILSKLSEILKEFGNYFGLHTLVCIQMNFNHLSNN